MTLTEQKFLTDFEADSLVSSLSAASPRDELLIKLTLFTGARCQEALNVRPKDLGEMSVTIYGLKGSDSRTIPILDIAFWNKLLEYIKNEGVHTESKIFTITSRQFQRIFKKYCPKKSPKAMRHSMGVRFYKASRDIKAVQQILGHRQLNNTQVYMNFVESQEIMRDKLGGLYGSSVKHVDNSTELRETDDARCGNVYHLGRKGTG